MSRIDYLISLIVNVTQKHQVLELISRYWDLQKCKIYTHNKNNFNLLGKRNLKKKKNLVTNIGTIFYTIHLKFLLELMSFHTII